MIDSTSVLFGLEDEFVVTSLERLSSSDLRVVIEHREREVSCPACGVLTSRVKERPLVQVKDLDVCGQVLQLWCPDLEARCDPRVHLARENGDRTTISSLHFWGTPVEMQRRLTATRLEG